MNNNSSDGKPRDAHDKHHARKRRQRRDASKSMRSRFEREVESNRLLIYGLHTVRAALQNPERKHIGFYATQNALARLELNAEDLKVPFELSESRDLDRMVGSDAVHQGVVLETEPLQPKPLESLGDADLVLVLDQVTDPHNVGAILRSAVALGAAAVITTSRHSPTESGVLAKSASGALEMIDLIEVRNLAETLETLATAGYQTTGLDSEGEKRLEECLVSEKIALVLGAEGKGLRQKTRQTCTTLARLDMPGAIKSLNVSNAAALSLYVARQVLDR